MARSAAHGGNCVAFARALTGINLDGNAATWWPHAAGRYERGQQPAVGAILVFKSHGRMRLGHVAVVTRIVSSREILVDHANWVRGRVTKAMSVVDSSAGHDWTSVKVLEVRSGTHGRDNPTFGFIYPRSLPVGFDRAVADVTPDHPDRVRTKRAAYRGSPDEPARHAVAKHATHHHMHPAENQFVAVY